MCARLVYMYCLIMCDNIVCFDVIFVVVCALFYAPTAHFRWGALRPDYYYYYN